MKSTFSYPLLGFVSFFALTTGMLSDNYEASFGNGLMPRTLTNLQSFSDALGGAQASPITDSGNPSRPFQVQGDTFPDFASASQRSCSNQFQSCQEIANNGSSTLTVSQCTDQQTNCNKAQSTATIQNFQVLVSQNADFDFFCDS